LIGELPDNTTKVEISVSTSDMTEPFVVTRNKAFNNEYNVTDIPTGTNRNVLLIAYDTNRENVTAEGRIVTSVHHEIWGRIDFTYTAGSGSADLIVRFPE
jgi:hypothetical protein